MTQFHIYDLKKNPEGLHFEESLDLKAELMERNAEILDLSPVDVVGEIRFEAGFYFLNYQLSYQISMASSRSMTPVQWAESYPVMELFVENQALLKEKDLIDEDLVLIIEGDSIVLEDSIADNILLNLPAKVLTPEEAAGQNMPSGENWTVMTEEDFQAQMQEEKEANSPFAQLTGLFDQE
ncbi:nucleic acid-binding protein [Streptococcus varani]|uniref:Nucleic acid-binding protein n=1 Tax=Streptococcus varani TaxID=1608583 RepID=A0A0E4CTI4_9STRE|nr:YceD family protein [Streptococcus varani]CQR25787.1 nucleic acid-binding protein [Streptococcus varani]